MINQEAIQYFYCTVSTDARRSKYMNAHGSIVGFLVFSGSSAQIL